MAVHGQQSLLSWAVGNAAGLVAALLLAWSPAQSVQAQDNIAAAAAAFERAQAAELGGNHQHAAELYELADRLAPSAAALRSALRMRRLAGHTSIAATHAETLLRRYPQDADSQRLAEEALRELQPMLTRVAVSCTAPCTPLVDGALTASEPAIDHVVYITPGEHHLAASFGQDTTEETEIQGTAGQQTEVTFEQPPPSERNESLLDGYSDGSGAQGATGSARDDEADAGGLSPWFFGIGAGITVALGAATLWSGLDVLDKHDSYDRSAPDAQDKYEDGQDREQRTNILIGATCATAAITIVLGVLTDWDGSGDEEEELPVTVSPTPDGLAVSYRTSWQ